MKKIKLLFTLMTVALLSVSCLVDDENDTGFQSSPYIVGFEVQTATNSYFEDQGVVTVEYPVSLLGGQSGVMPTMDINVNATVNTAMSTATQGVEFDLPLSSLTLPAGSVFAQFPVDINTGSFNPDEPTSVFIDLTTDTAGTVVSQINKTIEIKFVGCLATIEMYDYATTFDYTNLDGDFFDDVDAGVQSFTPVDGVPNNYGTDSTPPWGPGQLAPGADAYFFEVICGDVFIQTQNLGNYWANTVEALAGATNPAGYVDETTGDVFISYKVCYAGNCRFLDVSYIRL